MSNTINDKKRKASEGDLHTELLLEIKAELVSTKAELMAEVQALKKQLIESKVNPPKLEVSSETNLKGTSAPAKEETESDDEESVADNPWSVMFRQLRDYRILHGDCKVPFKCEANPKLGKWVDKQKQLYRNVKVGKSGAKLISQERIVKLDSLGMNWGKKYPAPIAWDEHFEEVKKYKEAIHSDPPVNSTNPSPLALWISAQRTEYRRFKKGRDSLLTTEQIGQLNGIGFNWKGPRLS